MKFIAWFIPLVVASGLAAVVSCSSSEPTYPSPRGSYGTTYTTSAEAPGLRTGPPVMSPNTLYRQVNVRKDLIPKGKHARRYKRRMNPRYITIHSTQNYSSTADAWQHSKALKNGKLRAYKRRGGNRIGYLVWHYTIDQSRCVQHLPDNEQGEHADFNGPGNNYSLGLEMCENRGNSRAATVERTAKLAAYLMYKHKIPIENVVAHYHWPRYGLSTPHKNCPHFLMDHGRPGRKWAAFKDKVNGYYKLITQPTQIAPIAPPAPVPAPNPYQQYNTPQPYPAPAQIPHYTDSPASAYPQQPQRHQPYNPAPSNNPYGVPSLQ